MFSRIIKTVWQLSAQSMGAVNYSLCNIRKAVYLSTQGSSYSTSMTQRLAASLEKAKPNQEIYRPSKRKNSFISPLLGPLRFCVKGPFFWPGAMLRKYVPLIFPSLEYGDLNV
jgi:hypothetical protein